MLPAAQLIVQPDGALPSQNPSPWKDQPGYKNGVKVGVSNQGANPASEGDKCNDAQANNDAGDLPDGNGAVNNMVQSSNIQQEACVHYFATNPTASFTGAKTYTVIANARTSPTQQSAEVTFAYSANNEMQAASSNSAITMSVSEVTRDWIVCTTATMNQGCAATSFLQNNC
jgi:hypothetical protein